MRDTYLFPKRNLAAGIKSGFVGGWTGGLLGGIGAGLRSMKNGGSFWEAPRPKVTTQSTLTPRGVQQFEATKPKGDLSGLKRVTSKSPHWPTNHKVVTSKFNLSRLHPKDGFAKAHLGVDIRSRLNESNYAIQDGVVSEVYAQGKGAGGNYLKIEHANGTESGYFHTKTNLSVGDFVRRGQVIGVSDGSGIISAPHLHFTLKVNDKLVNPMEYLNFLGKIIYK